MNSLPTCYCCVCQTAVKGDQKCGVHKNDAGGKDCLGTSVAVC